MSESEITNPQSFVDIDPPPIIIAFIHQDDNEINKLCASCVKSKFTQVVRQNKTMIPTTKKLEKVHANLWGPHNPPSQSRSVYTAILICKHI